MAGLFILSLDTEIAWGTYGAAAIARQAYAFDNYRSLLKRLVALLDTYQIPATFAVVGHLFLKPGDPRALIATNLPADDPHLLWYFAPNVIETIRHARTGHEIGTHTFSHLFTSEVTQKDWDADLKLCVRIHKEHNLTLRSLVYPRNQIAYTETLPKYGITSYRGAETKWYRQQTSVSARLLSFLDYLLALPPVTYDPASLRADDKLVNLPASQFLLSYDGLRGKIPTAARVQQAKRGIERAVRYDHLYHLWFHPFNLGSNEKMFEALEAILWEIARRRDVGDLRVMTMAQAAAWILEGMNG